MSDTLDNAYLEVKTIEICRWCGIERRFSGDFVELKACVCGASNSSVLSIEQTSGHKFEAYINPDNSLFLEFTQKDGKCSRYTLSAELLLKTGALQLSDTPLNGKK